MKNKRLILFIGIIFIVSLLVGFIYGINNQYDLTSYINNLTNHNNIYFKHILIISFFFLSTVSLLSIIFGSIYICFEGLSIGYIIAVFFANYKIKGLLYALYVILINKFFYLLIVVYLFIVGYKYFKNGLSNLVGDSKDYFSYLIKPIILKYLIITTFVLIYDTFLYFFGNSILKSLINVI